MCTAFSFFLAARRRTAARPWSESESPSYSCSGSGPKSGGDEASGEGGRAVGRLRRAAWAMAPMVISGSDSGGALGRARVCVGDGVSVDGAESRRRFSARRARGVVSGVGSGGLGGRGTGSLAPGPSRARLREAGACVGVPGWERALRRRCEPTSAVDMADVRWNVT